MHRESFEQVHKGKGMPHLADGLASKNKMSCQSIALKACRSTESLSPRSVWEVVASHMLHTGEIEKHKWCLNKWFLGNICFLSPDEAAFSPVHPQVSVSLTDVCRVTSASWIIPASLTLPFCSWIPELILTQLKENLLWSLKRFRLSRRLYKRIGVHASCVFNSVQCFSTNLGSIATFGFKKCLVIAWTYRNCSFFQ